MSDSLRKCLRQRTRRITCGFFFIRFRHHHCRHNSFRHLISSVILRPPSVQELKQFLLLIHERSSSGAAIARWSFATYCYIYARVDADKFFSFLYSALYARTFRSATSLPLQLFPPFAFRTCDEKKYHEANTLHNSSTF